MEIILASEQQTQEAAKNLAQSAPRQLIVFLKGDLGAGKTTFVRNFLQALGLLGKVKSPTFTLVEPYSINDYTVFHFDLYRLNDPEELNYIGMEDYFAREAIFLIEWPEKAGNALPVSDVTIELQVIDEHQRLLLMSAQSIQGEKLMREYEKNYLA